MDTTTRLLKMEESLRAAGRLERETLALAAFEVFISPQALDHLSFATPVSPGPADWTAHVAALKEAGLRCEMRAPLMALEGAAAPVFSIEEQRLINDRCDDSQRGATQKTLLFQA